MYAVFVSGGKQYRAAKGDIVRLEKIDASEGDSLTFDDVLLVGQGADITVGKPHVAGTTVSAKVLRQGKSRKVPVVKFKRRQNYLRQGSHRQHFTEVEITAIGAGTKKAAAKKADAPADKPAAKKAPAKKPAKKKAAKKAASKTSSKKAPAKKAKKKAVRKKKT